MAIVKVLLVDDVQLFLQFERTFFERTGCQILTASSGDEALASAFAICPEDTESIEPGEQCDVILVDRERTLYGPPGASAAPGY